MTDDIAMSLRYHSPHITMSADNGNEQYINGWYYCRQHVWCCVIASCGTLAHGFGYNATLNPQPHVTKYHSLGICAFWYLHLHTLMLQSTGTHSFCSKTIYYAQLLTDVFCAWGSVFLGVRTSTRHTSLRCTWWLWMLCNGLPWYPCFNYPYHTGSLLVMRGCFRIPGINYFVPGVSGPRGEWSQGRVTSCYLTFLLWVDIAASPV